MHLCDEDKVSISSSLIVSRIIISVCTGCRLISYYNFPFIPIISYVCIEIKVNIGYKEYYEKNDQKFVLDQKMDN